MASTSETGHAKNVANFEDLISFCTGYGASYAPSKVSITLPRLSALYIDGQASIAAVTSGKNSFDNATGARQATFAPLRALGTRIVNALAATDAPDTVIKDAKTINRKLQGKSAPKGAAPAAGTPPPASRHDIHIAAKLRPADRQLQ